LLLNNGEGCKAGGEILAAGGDTLTGFGPLLGGLKVLGEAGLLLCVGGEPAIHIYVIIDTYTCIPYVHKSQSETKERS
jgi:hypothetical protein